MFPHDSNIATSPTSMMKMNVSMMPPWNGIDLSTVDVSYVPPQFVWNNSLIPGEENGSIIRKRYTLMQLWMIHNACCRWEDLASVLEGNASSVFAKSA